MIQLHHEPWFTFRFADDRIVSRFRLEGVVAGCPVSVIRIEPDWRRLAKAVTGDDGWVDLAEPIVVRAGDAFLAVPVTAPIVRDETATDHSAIRGVNERAFGQPAEASLVDALRRGGHMRCSLVADVGGHLVGHILFSDLAIVTASGTVPALALAPMAVLPEFQDMGIGSALVRQGLEVCRQRGHRMVVVLGHAHYYPRFGFSAELARPLESPYAGDSFMAIELVTGALEGVVGRVEYAAPFHEL